MLYSADRGVSSARSVWRALGVSLGLCIVCASCGGKAYGDEETDEPGSFPSGPNAGVVTPRPVATGSDTTRPNTVGNTPQTGAAGSGGGNTGGFAPLPGEPSTAWVERLLADNCAGCHGEASSVNALIMSGWIIPGEPASSPAIQVLMSRTPPHDALQWPSEPEILRICEYALSFGTDCRTLFGMLRPSPR
jgi:hypothetical protein